MRNSTLYTSLRKWALQDSNLRPSDYESVSRPSETNTQLASQRKGPRQTATTLATSRQQESTPDATHLAVPHVLDRTPAHLLWTVRGFI